jgi:diguanylate cyclase (GGDEF)-like protein/PAS domain S-box-containing protein
MIRSFFRGKDQVSKIISDATKKQNSLIVVAIAFLITLAGLFFTRASQPESPILSYLFISTLVVELLIGLLVWRNKQKSSQILVLTYLWVLFSVVGLGRGDTFQVMAAGYLTLMIIAGFTYHIRGVLVITIANIFMLGLISWLNFKEIRLFLIPGLTEPVKFIVLMLIIYLGCAYMLTTLGILEKTFREVSDYKRRYLSLFKDSPDAILLMDMDFNIIDINESGLKLTGYSLDEITKLNADDLVVDSDSVDEARDNLLKHREVGSFEHQIIHKDGSIIDVESMETLVTDDEGNVLHIQAVVRDVGARKRVEEYLTEYKQRYQAMYERADFGFLLIDMDLKIVALNQQGAAMLHGAMADFQNKPIKEILRADSYVQLKMDIEKLQSDGDIGHKQYRIATRSGHSLWVSANLGLVETNGENRDYVQFIMRDITDQKERERVLMNSLQEMETLAMTDPLTGLHNRRSIERYGQMTLDRAVAESRPFCVILVDVDQLKVINDNYGHHAGDKALSECAGVLGGSKRRDDAVGRWGGDEFLIVLPETTLHDAEAAAQRIQAQIDKVQIGTGHDATSLAASLGIAGFESLPLEGEYQLKDLIDMADKAMYAVKGKSGSRIAVAR